MKFILFLMMGASMLLHAGLVKTGDRVTDTETGLQWQNDDKIEMNWREAIEYCEDLDFGEYSDWRLPNKKELHSIVDYKTCYPSTGSVFDDTASKYYWTSTTDALHKKNAYVVDFREGKIYVAEKIQEAEVYVRCVRSGL